MGTYPWNRLATTLRSITDNAARGRAEFDPAADQLPFITKKMSETPQPTEWLGRFAHLLFIDVA
jgi:hypothetical protein